MEKAVQHAHHLVIRQNEVLAKENIELKRLNQEQQQQIQSLIITNRELIRAFNESRREHEELMKQLKGDQNAKRRKLMVESDDGPPFAKNALSSRIFVGGIKEGTTTVELSKFFAEEARKIEPDSTITDVFIPRPFRSFAYVSFSTPLVAKELIKIGQFTIGENLLRLSAPRDRRPQQQLLNSIQPSHQVFKTNVISNCQFGQISYN